MTLDEVIERLEGIFGYISDSTKNDVLHYLKEYRSDKAMWEADRKRYLNWIEQYKESREKHQQAVIELKKNPPLSWDELKQMEGKPVWVEEQYSFSDEWHGYWEVISSFCDDEYVDDPDPVIYMTDEEIRHKKHLGKTWQAYRKERDHDVDR